MRLGSLVLAAVVGVLSFAAMHHYTTSGSGEAAGGGPRRVVVVGGGLAGLSAALEASRAGAAVTLVEGQARLGGNSAKASSGMNAVGTPTQATAGVSDSLEAFVADTLRSGGGRSQEALVRAVAERSLGAYDFLTAEGVNLAALTQLGGHSSARTHRAWFGPDERPTNVGFHIVSKLIDAVNKSAGVEIRTGALMASLVVDGSGRVTGVELADGGRVLGDAVVLTTGGYGADNTGLLAEHVPAVANLATTNGPFALGQGVRAAQQAGAALVDMDQVQVHPTGFVNPGEPHKKQVILAPEALRGVGGILVDREGKRFVNELELRSVVTEAIFEHGFRAVAGDESSPKAAYMLLTDAACNQFGASSLGFYRKIGLLTEYADAAAVGAALGIGESALAETIAAYNAAADAGKDGFGKTLFPARFDAGAAIHVLMVSPAIHYSMGGVAIDTRAQVLGAGGPVAGLFAAGEVTGGVHGANRLAGNSLLECVAIGRVAGASAAAAAAA